MRGLNVNWVGGWVKLKAGAELTATDPTTYYTPGEKGYTDYL